MKTDEAINKWPKTPCNNRVPSVPVGSEFEGQVCREAAYEARSTSPQVSHRSHPDTMATHPDTMATVVRSHGEMTAWLMEPVLALVGGYSLSCHRAASFVVQRVFSSLRDRCRRRSRYLETGWEEHFHSLAQCWADVRTYRRLVVVSRQMIDVSKTAVVNLVCSGAEHLSVNLNLSWNKRH